MPTYTVTLDEHEDTTITAQFVRPEGDWLTFLDDDQAIVATFLARNVIKVVRAASPSVNGSADLIVQPLCEGVYYTFQNGGAFQVKP